MIQFILVGALAALPAMAGPITFTISQMAVSGSVGSTAFTNELVTFQQVVADTSDITTCSGYPCAPEQTLNSVTIATVGTFTLTSESYFFQNDINLIGITYTTGTAYLALEDDSDSVTKTYNMTSNLGPINYEFFGSSVVSGVATSGGTLSLSWNVDQEPTFQAVVGSPSSSTPEPGSLGLVLLGAIPLAAGLLRRRFHSRPASNPMQLLR